MIQFSYSMPTGGSLPGLDMKLCNKSLLLLAEVRNVVKFLRGARLESGLEWDATKVERIDHFQGKWSIASSFVHSTRQTSHNADGKQVFIHIAHIPPAYAKLRNVSKVEEKKIPAYCQLL